MEGQKPPPLYKKKEFIPLLIFFFLFLFLLISTRMTGRPPQIDYITPRIGYPGDVMVITGKNFGENRNGGEVIISGYSPVTSGYLEWTDTRISLRIPDDVNSGLTHVVAKNGKSKGIFFTNRQQIPVVLSGSGRPGQPHIRKLSEKSGSVGTLLILTGMNFGPKRGSSRVYFTWISEADYSSLIPALEYDHDYESWSDREILVHVPDGASSGHILVVTDKGESNALYFEVEGEAGTKLFPEKRTYAVQYSVETRNIGAAQSNRLYLWVPQILEAPEQREIQLVAGEPQPLFDDVNGVKLFSFLDLEEGHSYRVMQSFMFDRYSIETRIKPARVSQGYDQYGKLFKKNTSADEIVPADESRLKKLGKAIVGSERNPYYKAKAIYNWILNRMSVPDAGGLEESSPIKALDTRKGDAYIYAVLFCALARGVEIPSRLVAGYLVDRDLKSRRHFWVEFYLERIGWIPVDPFLGEGKGNIILSPEIDPRKYYFGNLDFNHITFSKGLIALNQMDPDGRAVRRKDIPSLQVIHEEAAGNLFSYSAYWSDLDVLGIY